MTSHLPTMQTLVRSCCSAEDAMAPASRLGRGAECRWVRRRVGHGSKSRAFAAKTRKRGRPALAREARTSKLAPLRAACRLALRHGRGGCAADGLLDARALAAIAVHARCLLRGAPRRRDRRHATGVAHHGVRGQKTPQMRRTGACGRHFLRSRSPNAARLGGSRAQVSGQAAEGFGGAWCVLSRGRSRRTSGVGRNRNPALAGASAPRRALLRLAGPC